MIQILLRIVLKMYFQKDASASNTIEDSGINAKFVNAVYDALLNTVSIIYETCKSYNCLSLYCTWKSAIQML